MNMIITGLLKKGASEADELAAKAALEAADKLIDGMAKDFFAVGKRKETAFSKDGQSVMARFMSDVIDSEWQDMSKTDRAAFLHRCVNISQARQRWEKAGILAKSSDSWE